MTGPDEAEGLRRLLLAHAGGDVPLTPECVDDDTIAALAEGSLDDRERDAVLAHVGACARCRGLVASVARALSDPAVAREIRAVEHGRQSDGAYGRRRRGRLAAGGAAAAAAAAVLLLARPGQIHEPPPHRASPITLAPAPEAIRPVGPVERASMLAWKPVPGADRYRIALFDAGGAVLYEAESPDTVAALPDSVLPRPGATYWWQVEARVGFDRWAASDLVEFSVTPDRAP